MAKLILSMDGLVLKEIPLAKERTTIGRKPHNDIQIDNLAVSGEHAVIVTIMNDCFLEDLGSTNGTLVNGAVAKKHFLQNNDVIELGKYKLKFINEGAAPAAAAADFEKTMVLRPAAMKQAAEQARAIAAGQPTAPPDLRQRPQRRPRRRSQPRRPPRARPSPACRSPAGGARRAGSAQASATLGAIQILSGASAGKELELTKPLTTLGRPGVQVAVLTRRPQGYFITHVEGAKQPHVNGQAIGTAPCALKDHDLIELAGVKMEFFLKS